MTTREELRPLFTDITLSADDAEAIVAALRDIAETDGVHDEELALINEFVESLDLELGESEPTKLEAMTPAKLAAQVIDPTVRMVALQTGILLAMADGDISDKERAKVKAYGAALGIEEATYDKMEAAIVDWVKSGDLESVIDA